MWSKEEIEILVKYLENQIQLGKEVYRNYDRTKLKVLEKLINFLRNIEVNLEEEDAKHINN